MPLRYYSLTRAMYFTSSVAMYLNSGGPRAGSEEKCTLDSFVDLSLVKGWCHL